MAAETELKIVIKGKDEASPAIGKVESMLKTLAGAYIGIKGLQIAFNFLKDSIEEAAEKEASLNRLGVAITNSGQNWDEAKASLIGFSEQLEKTTTFTDTEVLNALTQLTNFGMTAAESQKSITAAMDLAVAKGIDLNTSITLIGKAYQGNTETLKRYGIEASSFNDLMGQVNEKFGGQAAAQMNTYSGQMKLLQANFNDMKEDIGKYWMPVINSAVKALNQLLGKDEPAGGQTNTEVKLKSITDAIAEMETREIKTNAEMITNARALTFARAEQARLMLQLGKEQVETNKANKEEEVQIEMLTQERKNQIWNDTYETQMSKETALLEFRRAMGFIQAEEEAIKWDAIVSTIDAAYSAVNDLGIASNNIFIKGAATVLKGVESVAKGIESIMSGGIIGWIIGLLNIATGVINISSAFEDLSNLSAENEALATSTASTTTAGTSNITSNSEKVTTIERSSAPTYYYINNSYNLNAGMVLGEESIIDKAFKELMKRYDQQTSLVRAG